MKLLVANNYYYLRGGAERVMFNDIRALSQAGMDVTSFSAIDAANVPSEYSQYFARGADIHATRPLDRARAAREAIHCARTARAFGVALDALRPDVLHFHNIYGRLTTSILPVARQRGIPSVLTVHDYKLVCPSYLTLRGGKPCTACVDGGYYRCAVHRCHKQNLAASAVYAIEAYYSRLSDSYGAISLFLCPSRFMADLLIRSGIDSKRVLYHPNSVDPQLYTPSYEGEYVLYTGRLSHEKGIATLVNAIKNVGIPLRIAGAGPMEELLKSQAAGAGGSRIIFEGHCDGDRLAALYRNAAFVVVPSEWNENAPMAVLEAFAYGKPVVGCRIGGIPEMIEDGQNGYLVNPGDASRLQSAILSLWFDAEGRRRMGRNARQLVESRYSQEHRTASLLAIYDGLRTSTKTAAWPANVVSKFVN